MAKTQKDLFGNVPIGSYRPFSDRQIKTFKKQLSDKIKNYLIDRGSYDEIDDDLIAVYVQSISDIRKYSAILEKEGDLIPSKGSFVSHPLLSLKQKAFDNSSKLADKLGILSMNRKRLDGTVTDPGSNADDPFAEFEK
jgi:P27 family predicted phage terminase small subunit